MTPLFIRLEARKGGEIFSQPFRGFLKMQTKSRNKRGSEKLDLLQADGKKVGHVIFRWREAARYTHQGQPYRAAIGVLDDIQMEEEGFNDEEVVDLIRDAMEKSGWQYYLFKTAPKNSSEQEIFEQWVTHYLPHK